MTPVEIVRHALYGLQSSLFIGCAFSMHLKQLKLAGFKSFVEPTIVPFSSQLVAVVGPNGCGKSNIIDAVRWVMGESHAKNLRGESMADVIFNGSSNRKSIGQASVELVFDNSMGRLVGQYASYQEIAVKRVVTRDGGSFYYLNGTRCRRRDVTDLFLGTGAGARGYSIIGQDTISRLIEARPDDLRAYLEEAAGVSKYKERRRETVQRINSTRENLARIADIRDELEKQLSKLERQAKAAERYKSLKHDERLCKADILALKWRALTTEQAQIVSEINKLTLQHEHHQTNITGLIKENTDLRGKLHTAQDDFQHVQVEFYQLSTEIARLEEGIQQRLHEGKRLAEDKQQLETDLQIATQQLRQHTDALGVCEHALANLLIDVNLLSQELKEHQQSLDTHALKKTDWDMEWQTVQMELHRLQREAEVEQLSLQHLQQRHQHSLLRFEKNQNEQEMIAVEPLQIELLALQNQHINLDFQQKIDANNHNDVLKTGMVLRQELSLIAQQLHQAHDNVQSLTTEHAGLFAAQNALLHKVPNDLSPLSEWEKNPRLAEVIAVPDEWVQACELVLGDVLDAIVLSSMDSLTPSLVGLKDTSVTFVLQQNDFKTTVNNYPRLSDKIVGKLPCWPNALDQIFAAESLSEALGWLPTLNGEQSIVTQDGFWLGLSFVRVGVFTEQDEAGLLFRGQALAKLKDALVVLQANLSDLQTSRDKLHVQLVKNEHEVSESQQRLLLSQEAFRANEANLNNKQRALEHALLRVAALNEERLELHLANEELATQTFQTEHKWQVALAEVVQQELRQGQLLATKAVWEDALTVSRRGTDEGRAALHHAEMQYSKETIYAQQLRDSIAREQRQMATLSERLDILNNRLNELEISDGAPISLLQDKVLLHHQQNEALAQLRQRVDELQQQLNGNELFGKQEDQLALLVQEKILQQQLHEQGLVVRAGSYLESLVELGVDVESLLEGIPNGVTLTAREQGLVDIDEKIKRLGAINLLAIEEYQTDCERKQYLDEQYQDLMTALETLETAIAKMDKETHLRLKDTFEQVNMSFQSLFPRLFGGGRAMLTLTCDNLLEAGILVMAQPPGKRNSTIHLLSGGEKAMTAVALVFAIFQLNPSPFCMLDEVDAPLDDLNVRRFCDLVREMSKFVQFLFITHNKVTMELADHLIGVTMREPGVSRVVAVDVEEALSMAE